MDAPKVGLIFIDHGAPMPPWNKAHEEMLPAIEKELGEEGYGGVFAALRWCHMEFAEPDIKTTMNRLEAEGMDRVVAIPIFTSVSSHSERDLPNALNIRYHPDQDPKIPRYVGSLPVTMCTPLDHQHDVLPTIIAEQAKEMLQEMRDPSRTAVLVLSHGDGCEHFWQHLHRRINEEVLRSAGVRSCEGLYVQTVRSPQSQRRVYRHVSELLSEEGVGEVMVLSASNGTTGASYVQRINKGLHSRGEPGLPDAVHGCTESFLKHPLLIKALVRTAVGAYKVSLGLEPVPSLQGDESKMVPPYNPPFWLTRDIEPDFNDRMIIGSADVGRHSTDTPAGGSNHGCPAAATTPTGKCPVAHQPDRERRDGTSGVDLILLATLVGSLIVMGISFSKAQ
ncbi:hypothetical protein FOZ62_016021 [Perkinsus olseni]|uniref:Sirohydrochlorin cobaltochelatase n=1 Tax=Perkinsus olseni TaxID=32597 RepID=A0A7J6TMZ0_PEROL|nr:hypothetical protein FOZ62_016021 [Perkinsus olseni]